MFLQRPPPHCAIARAADQRNWKRLSLHPTILLRAEIPLRSGNKPKERRTAAGHQGRRCARPHQPLLQLQPASDAARRPPLSKSLRAGSHTTRIPRMRLETNYFILLRFGCQTGAQVAIGLGRVDMHAGSHQQPGARGASGSGNSSVPRPMPTAVPPSRKNGTSLPSCSASSHNFGRFELRGPPAPAAPAAPPPRRTIRRPARRPWGSAW